MDKRSLIEAKGQRCLTIGIRMKPCGSMIKDGVEIYDLSNFLAWLGFRSADLSCPSDFVFLLLFLQQEDDEMLVPHNDFVNGPQPLEAASKVDAQAVDNPPSGMFTSTIENFSRHNTKKLYSDIFFVGGYKWQIFIFPKVNNVDHLSMYLDVADLTTLME